MEIEKLLSAATAIFGAAAESHTLFLHQLQHQLRPTESWSARQSARRADLLGAPTIVADRWPGGERKTNHRFEMRGQVRRPAACVTLGGTESWAIGGDF